ncbi:hypothetical protein CSUI_009892, partial [Cystoisospora suis]
TSVDPDDFFPKRTSSEEGVGVLRVERDERFETRRILDPQTHQIHIVKAKPRPPPVKKLALPSLSKAPVSSPPVRNRQERNSLPSQEQQISDEHVMNGETTSSHSSSSRRTSRSTKNVRSTKMVIGEGGTDRLSTASEASPDVPVSPRTVSLMLSQIGSTRIG